MIRWLGALLVAAGAAAAGLSASQRLGTRARLLAALSGALDLMQSEITFNLTPLPALMTYLARRAAGPVRPFFAHCARLTERLGEEPFHALWQKAVTEAGADWRAGERSAMMDLGGALGRYDQEAQARALTQTRARLETLLTEAEGERTRQGRVYRALGLACGLAIVIILI